jgi:immunoglobulin-binding protein 1
MSSDEELHSIRSLFDAAEAKRSAVESSHEPSTSPAYGSLVDAALSLYARAVEQAAAVSLFSPNELAEDISTPSLPFLLAEFRIAELVQRTRAVETAERLAVVRRAAAAYDRFLSLVDGYGLVGPPYSKLLERYREGEEDGYDRDFVGGGNAGFSVVTGVDAAAKRESKIASFRAEKELKSRLEALRGDPRYLEHGDEEVVRELYLTDVTFAIHSTFQALDSLSREQDMLAQAPAPSAPTTTNTPGPGPRDRLPAIEQDASYRLDSPFLQNPNGRSNGPILSQKGKPLQPFTLVGSRADLARGVFRPGHNLPTMSIDEYLAEERRRGNIIEGGGEQPRKVVDEDDMDAVDRETYKARQWDDYTDDNPRGSGNTMNMG